MWSDAGSSFSDHSDAVDDLEPDALVKSDVEALFLRQLRSDQRENATREEMGGGTADEVAVKGHRSGGACCQGRGLQTTRARRLGPVVARERRAYAAKLCAPLEAALVVGFDKDRLPSHLQARVRAVASEIAMCIVVKDDKMHRGDTSRPFVRIEARAVQQAAKAKLAKHLTHALSDPLNMPLRLQLLSGKLAPETFVEFDDDELSNSKIQQERTELRAQLSKLRDAKAAAIDGATITELFSCPECGCTRCFLVSRAADKQKWSGDDASPNNLTCVECGCSFRR